MALISVQVYILLNLCYAKPRSCEFGSILGIDAGLADCTLLFRHTWSSCRHKPCWCWDFRMDRGYWWHPQDHARVGGHYRSLCYLCTTYVKNIQPFLYRLTNHRKLVVSRWAYVYMASILIGANQSSDTRWLQIQPRLHDQQVPRPCVSLS
jgi:hypothetical protein